MAFKAFTSKQLAFIADFNVKNLHGYVEAGKIVPGVQVSKGSGTINLFSSINLMQARIAQECISLGIARRTVFKLMESVVELGVLSKLDPYAIQEAGGLIFLHFYCYQEDGSICFNCVVEGKASPGEQSYTGAMREYLGFIDLNDYDTLTSSLRFNLSRLSKEIIKKVVDLDI